MVENKYTKLPQGLNLSIKPSQDLCEASFLKNIPVYIENTNLTWYKKSWKIIYDILAFSLLSIFCINTVSRIKGAQTP